MRTPEGGSAPPACVSVTLVHRVTRYRARITWRCDEDSLAFVSEDGVTPAQVGQQVFNNYGPKSNEEFLVGYGFCIPDNPQVGCWLVRAGAARVIAVCPNTVPTCRVNHRNVIRIGSLSKCHWVPIQTPGAS